MSTYSWSYKTASHRQSSTKRAQTEQEDSAENDVCQIERDKLKLFVLSSSSSQDNSTVSTGTTKRLNWRAKIYVGNLNKKTNEASLAYYFSVFGDIEDIKLIRDHDTKESRGFAFITFEKIESAEKAKKWCSFNYPSLDDNSITVASAERKSHKINISKNAQLSKRDPSQTLFWEFKWTNSDEAQIYGPYETSLMQAWKNQGYFDRGCWVRQVIHRQISKTGEVELKAEANIPKGDLKDERSDGSSCKKPKLMIDYSDSEEESEDSGVTGDAGGQLRDKQGHDEVIMGNKMMGKDREGCERSREVMVGEEIEMKQGRKEDEQVTESLKIKDGSEKDGGKEVEFVQEYKATEGLNLSRRYQEGLGETSLGIRCGETMHRGNLQQNEDGYLILKESDKQKDLSVTKSELKTAERDHILPSIKTKHEVLKTKDLEPTKDEEKESEMKENSTPIVTGHRGSMKDKDGLESHNEILELCEHEGQVVEQSESRGNTVCKGNFGSSNVDHEQAMSSNTQEKGIFDILELYAQEATVLPESDNHDERRIHDADLRLSDDSSSDENDLDDVIDDISTEFVVVTEIDFNLYP